MVDEERYQIEMLLSKSAKNICSEVLNSINYVYPVNTGADSGISVDLLITGIYRHAKYGAWQGGSR